MYNERIENLIKAALADGELTEKEKQILFKNAQTEGIDLDEFEMVLEARLVELEKAKREAAPKSNKYGDVRKCPACGALVPAFKGVCQECGFEFTNIDANLSSKQLADKLLKENDDKKKIEIIETFPIPTTKADLLEFLTSLKPRVLGEYNQYTDAYFKKYQECIEKAKVAFNEDKQLKPFVEGFSEIENRKKALKKSQVRKGRLAKVVAPFKSLWETISDSLLLKAIVLVVFLIFAIKGVKFISQNKEKQQMERFETALTNGDLHTAKVWLEENKNRFNEHYEDREKFNLLSAKLIESYLEVNNLKEAEYVYNNIIYDSYRDDKSSCRMPIYIWTKENGHYDKAWDYYKKHNSNIHDADDYYEFMLEIISYLCNQNKKKEALEFVNKYSIWFKTNVDNSTTTEEYKTQYKNYKYTIAKKNLLEDIKEM